MLVVAVAVAVAVAYNTPQLLSNFGAYLLQQQTFQQLYITRHGSCTLTLARSNTTERNEGNKKTPEELMS